MEFSVVAGLIVMGVLLIMSVPIVAALGLGAIVTLYLADLPYLFFMNKMFEGCQTFPLLAVPFFVLAGEIMQRGTMAENLLKLSRTLVGHITGGMGHISVLTALFYGALSGSSPATVSAVGGIMIPSMEKDKYPVLYSTALNCTAGTLGVLIPPSVPLIIYGTLANVSIGDLFIAGIMPGLFIGVALMLYNFFVCKIKGYGHKLPRASAREKWEAFKDAKYALAVPVIIMGGIYGGFITPSEAGAVAVLYSLIVEAFITRTLTWKALWQIFKNSVIVTATIFIIVTTAIALGQIYTVCNVVDACTQFLATFAGNKYLLEAVMICIYLVLGTFLDMTPILVMTIPLFAPSLQAAGINPIHFGLVTIVALAIGFMTPPVGVNLYVGCGISGVKITKLSLAMLPFVAVMIICLFVLAYVPQITLCLL